MPEVGTRNHHLIAMRGHATGKVKDMIVMNTYIFLHREYGSTVLMRPWRWSLIEAIKTIFLVFDMRESKMLINDNINDIMKENIE